MVLPNPTAPSQLWRAALPEDRAFLERIVVAVHRMWQESEHYSPKTVIERMPRTELVWSNDIPIGTIDLSWAEDGIDVAIVVCLNTSGGIFHLLGSQAQIHLLSNWLFAGGLDGFPDQMSDLDMDRFDVRRHLDFVQEKPSALMWSAVQLYELCLYFEPIYAVCGLDGWVFWRDNALRPPQTHPRVGTIAITRPMWCK